MKLRKVSNGTALAIAVGVILLCLIVAVVYFKGGKSFSVSVPEKPQVISDSYGNTATALRSDPSVYQNASTTDAATAAAYSLTDNSEIWSWNEGKRWPIASLTKLMTALIATRLIPPGQEITVSSTDERYLIDATATPTFRAGDTLTSKDLITSMLIVSSDDAAEALADYYGRDKFLKAMNDMASTLGMKDTTFVSPSGLSPDNLSTTADLYKLVEFIWSTEPSFFAVTRETKAAVTVYRGNAATARYLTNIDEFAGRKDFLGGKTGTLPVSAQDFIAIFNVEGPKAIIILGSDDRYAEAEKILATL